MGKISYRM